MGYAEVRRPWVAAVEAAAQAALAADASGHDLHHAFRVRGLAVRLSRIVGADRDVVEAAALLHDIAHGDGRTNHASTGARRASEILVRGGFPAGKIAAVTECIEHHHWRPSREGDPANPTLEYQSFADADRLDALGAIGIARTFAFGGAYGRPIWNPNDQETSHSDYGRSSIHHFCDKLLQLEHGMYTAPARRLAAQRTATLRTFIETFFGEWNLQDLETIESPGDTPRSSDRQKAAPARAEFSRL
jgi:uncharacterized protein